VNTWGDDIYFSIPVHLGEEDGQGVVEMGDLGYWPAGNGFCIFFGPTPMPSPGEVRPASAVNVFGKIEVMLPSLRKNRWGGGNNRKKLIILGLACRAMPRIHGEKSAFG